eukprot:CAMPEP_0119385428 /NCGR_PEP_ID=MMETSP1334-20130426/91183_1 /TAXON_ID=127549 /ORGANISM="Calcidiscus leptoporus, Strain RCC1130" /LENGTH=74 /DNA_ID=CAMNT_0007406715 /DNA_START=207 /DNA_END=427 /DNA_ORIENTATION=-
MFGSSGVEPTAELGGQHGGWNSEGGGGNVRSRDGAEATWSIEILPPLPHVRIVPVLVVLADLEGARDGLGVRED